MVYMQKTILGLLLAGLLSAAEPGSAVSTKTPIVKITDKQAVAHSPSVGLAGSGASNDATVVATVRSSSGLILNGVPTPRGVNSVVVTRGDVVETIGAPAIATYATGQSVNLSSATSYQSLPGGLVPTITNTQPTKATLFDCPQVSQSKHPKHPKHPKDHGDQGDQGDHGDH